MECYETKDTALASYLLATEHQLLGIAGPKGQRVFRFAGVSDGDRLAYYQDAPVGARKLFESYRTLKGLLFAG